MVLQLNFAIDSIRAVRYRWMIGCRRVNLGRVETTTTVMYTVNHFCLHLTNENFTSTGKLEWKEDVKSFAQKKATFNGLMAC